MAGGQAARRFHTLDAMRGVAALAVFTGHAGALIEPLRFSHNYLAVDLFFLLSGFVIDHAYGPRLANGLGAGRFMLARYVRLYPLYLIGVLIGLTGMGIALAAGQGVFTGREFAVAAATALLLLPSPTWWVDAFLMPVNYPGWSLFFELVANAAYAFFYRLLGRGVLLAVAALSAALLIDCALGLGTVDGGNEWHRGWIGLARVGFSFPVGVLLHRMGLSAPRRTMWAYVLPVAILPLFLNTGGAVGDVVKILLLFPAVVLIASRIEPTRPRLADWLGTASYPLYVVHLPTIQFLERVSTVLHIDRARLAPWGGLILAALIFAAALVADRLYDRPVRTWLMRRLGLSERRKPQAATQF